MAAEYPTGPVQSMIEELEELRKNWIWFLMLGIGMIVLGCLAIGASCIASLAVAITFGVLMVIGGVMNLLSSFQAPRWSGFFLHLMAGVLYVVVGLLVLRHPLAGMVGLTLILAVLFLVGGLFRIVSALSLRFHNWGWVLVSGIITLLLGLYIIASDWPETSMWILGTFVGVDLLFNGWSWVMLALAVKGSPRPLAP